MTYWFYAIASMGCLLAGLGGAFGWIQLPRELADSIAWIVLILLGLVFALNRDVVELRAEIKKRV
jgi:di/tricarboxylate transporter